MAAPQPQAAAVSSASGVSGPGSAGGPGPQQQPQPTQLVGSAQSGLLQQQQQDFDPVQRYKMLIPQLKESLQVMGPARGARGAGWRAGGLRGRAPRGCLLKERS
jgi:mediator of RNA polymerase II transcription subunit 29